MPTAAPDTNGSFSINGVQFFASSEQPGTLFYVPNPVPELGPTGQPAVTVVRTPQNVMLQVGARFTVPDSELAALKAQIAAARKSASIELQPAPLDVSGAALLLKDERGTLETLATSATSRFVPFNAVFSVSLDPARGSQAISAVNGQRGILFVEYSFSLPANLRRRAVSDSDSRCADVAAWIARGGSGAHMHVVG